MKKVFWLLVYTLVAFASLVTLDSLWRSLQNDTDFSQLLTNMALLLFAARSMVNEATDINE